MLIPITNNSLYAEVFNLTSIDTDLLTADTQHHIIVKMKSGYRVASLIWTLHHADGTTHNVTSSNSISAFTYNFTKKSDGTYNFNNVNYTDIIAIEINDNPSTTPTALTQNELAYTNNLSNFTLQDVVSTFYERVASALLFSPKGSVTQSPTMTVNGNNVTIQSLNVITDNAIIPSYRFPLTSANAVSGNTIILNGVSVLPTITITDNLQNASIDSLVFDISTSNAYTVTPDSGYSFSTAPYLDIDGTQLVFTENNGIYSLTVDGTQYPTASVISVNGIASFVVSESDIQLDNTHIEFTENSVTKINNRSMSYYVEIRPKAGYSFESIPKLKAVYETDKGKYATLSYPMVLTSGTESTYHITLNVAVAGGNSASNFFNANVAVDLPMTVTEVITETPLISDFGAVRAYKTNKTINNNLKAKRFWNPDTSTYEDLGQYIISFVRYPFNVDTDGNTSVKYGWFDTQIKADLAEQQIFELSLGKKLLCGLYGDTSDIAKCDITLILPYYGTCNLDGRFINTEIEIVYKVDILANTANIFIYSNESIVDVLNCSIGYDIPYILRTDKVEPSVNLKSNILKAYEPKAIIRQKAKVSGLNYQTAKHTDLNDIQGFFKCDRVILSVNAQMTLAEQKAIVQQLQAGSIM